MRVATILVFFSGFAIMVLEIIGARFLAKDFGGSFYVWTSQIGVILVALAGGYYAGGALADRAPRGPVLGLLTCGAGLFTLCIPMFAGPAVNAIIGRHPSGQAIPPLWQKVDPALGSALVFLLPCFVLALLPPYLIRWGAPQLTRLGRTSGAIIAASTVGSIAGVFVSGYVLIDVMRLSNIFRATGGLMLLLGVGCALLARGPAEAARAAGPDATPSAR